MTDQNKNRPTLVTRRAPRSDGSTLHVDFEQYVDGDSGFLNAGIRFLGRPFEEEKFNQHEVAVLRDPNMAFSGTRCGYACSREIEQTAEITLQRRFDAPETSGNEVTELVFSPGIGGGIHLEDFRIWDPQSYQEGDGDVGICLLARGKAADRTYNLDVKGAGRAVRGAVKNLSQSQWVRIIMHRRRRLGKVDLWVVLGDRQEQKIGSFADRNPGIATGRAVLGDSSTDSARGAGYWDDIRVGKLLGKGMRVAPGEPMRNVSKETPKLRSPISVGKARQLFVDDVLIESMKKLSRTVHAAEKHPDNPLVSPEMPWEKNGKWFMPNKVLRKGPNGPFQAWMACFRGAGKLAYTCLLESQDGLTWNRPKVGSFKFGSSYDNNIVWTGRALNPFYDPREKNPARRYKSMTRIGGFSPVFSPDGRKWTMAPPAFNQGYDATGFYWDPAGKKWIASCKVFRDGKRIRGYAESSDFVNWSDTYPMLSHDEKDLPGDQIYSMQIFRYGTVYVGMPKIYHLATDQCDIQLAFSRNAKNWIRPDRTSFLANSPNEGDYDYGNIDEAGDPIRVGDQLWFYYSGRSDLHLSKTHTVDPKDDGRLCLATLRLDGFRSVDAGRSEGVLTTKPLLLKGRKLFVNADAKGGKVRVEIIDENIDCNSDRHNVPIKPYLRDDCTPITSDNVRQAVQWRGAEDLSRLKRGRIVRLRFYLRNAKLYSFWTE